MENFIRYVDTSLGIIFVVVITYFQGIIFALVSGFFLISFWIVLDYFYEKNNINHDKKIITLRGGKPLAVV